MTQREQNRCAIALLDEWLAAGDAEGEEADPIPVATLGLRDVSVE